MRSAVPIITVMKPVEKTDALSEFLSIVNRNTASVIPADARGIRRLAVCDIRSATLYSAEVRQEVYNLIRKNTSSFELKVPIARIAVFDTSFLYLFIFVFHIPCLCGIIR